VQQGRGTALLSFDLNGSLHHGNCLLSMLLGFGTEALDGSSGLLLASTTNKPPRRFRGEEEEDDEGSLDESALVGTMGRSGRRDSRGTATARQEALSKPTDRFACCSRRWRRRQ
jgi:hypothetical protein